MLKQEIIEKITKYFKLTHFEAEKIYDDIFQSIIQGVKSDNITDISNLGEFIIKYNENNTGKNKKTVEFLPSANLEDEVSEADGLEEAEVYQPDFTETVKEEIKKEVKPDVKEEIKAEVKEEIIKEVKEEIKEEAIAPVITAPVINKTEEHSDEHLSVEEEIKRKREEIIHKLDPQHNEEYHRLLHVKEGINLNVPKPVVIKDPVYNQKEEIKKEVPEVKKEIEEIKAKVPEVKEEIKEVKQDIKEIKEEITNTYKEPETKEKETVDELSTKSFSDYFTEIKQEQEIKSETYIPPVVPPVENVIPPIAVDLHKEIVGEQPPKQEKPVTSDVPEVPKQKPVITNGNGFNDDYEKKADDNSYYIWYKDSEPNAVDTQTMSYEYELLYQATKEAEYKSKLRIYVTTFIMFFSVVLILLIFSPVIYKYFFTPSDEQLNEQVQPQDEGSIEQPNNKADVNTLENTNKQPEQSNTTQAPPVTSNEQATQQQQAPPVQNEQKQNTQTTPPEQKTTAPPVTEQKTEQPPATQQQNNPGVSGVVKSNMGWIDEKNRVIYVQLENGKFTIQESAWDSNDKAAKRISTVTGFNIAGLSGNIFKVDLGAKGTWYRARFGEFSTIEEAKSKAEELRSKEKMKLQAFLLSIFMYA